MTGDAAMALKMAYETLWNLCPKPLNLGHWGSRPVDGCRATIRSGPDALRALQQAHSVDTLLAAHIVCRDERGEIRLNSLLCGNSGALIALRSAPDRPPYDVLTLQGLLYQRSWPALAAARDAATIKAAQDQQRMVFAAESIEDAVILRDAGLAATTMAGLIEYSKTRFMKLAAIYGDGEWPVRDRPIRHSDDSGHSASAEGATTIPATPDGAAVVTQTTTQAELPENPSGQFKLVLVGWSPRQLTLDLPLDVPFLARHLEDIRTALGIDLSRIGVWRPDAKSLKAMKTQAEFQDFDRMAATLRDSVRRIYDLAEFNRSDNRFPPDDRGPPTDLGEAHAALVAELEEDRCRPRHGAVFRREKDYEAIVNARITAPMQKAAMAETNPALRALAFIHAGLNTQVLLMQPRVQDLQQLALKLPIEGDPIDKALKPYLGLVTRVESYGRLLARLQEQYHRANND